MSARDTYSPALRVIHWATALAVVAAVVLGFVQEDAGASRAIMLRAHVLIGMTIVLLTIARLVARRRSPVAELPMQGWRRAMFRANHALLYVLLFALGASGMATSLASGLGPALMSGGELPDLEGLVPAGIHAALGLALIATIGMHVAGVVTYQLREGDTLGRMIGRRGASLRAREGES